MNKRFFLIVLLVSVMSACFVGCNGPAKSGEENTSEVSEPTEAESQTEEKPKIKAALVVLSTASEYWLPLEAGALKALDEIYGEGNYEWIYTGPATADVAKQIDIVYNLVEAKVDILMVVPIHPDSLVEPIEAAMDAGIATVVIDCRLNSDNVVTYVATDNFGSSKDAVDRAIKLLAEDGITEGSVSIINTPIGFPSNDARTDGARAAVESSNLTLLEVQYGQNQEEFMSKAENIITATDDLVLMFAGHDRSSLGAIAAVENAGIPDENLFFIAFDVTPDIIKYLEVGLVDMIIAQNPFQHGYIGVQSAFKWMNGETLESVIWSPTTLITQENMNDEDVQAVIYPMGKGN